MVGLGRPGGSGGLSTPSGKTQQLQAQPPDESIYTRFLFVSFRLAHPLGNGQPHSDLPSGLPGELRSERGGTSTPAHQDPSAPHGRSRSERCEQGGGADSLGARSGLALLGPKKQLLTRNSVPQLCPVTLGEGSPTIDWRKTGILI